MRVHPHRWPRRCQQGRPHSPSPRRGFPPPRYRRPHPQHSRPGVFRLELLAYWVVLAANLESTHRNLAVGLQYGGYERRQALRLVDDHRFDVPLYTIGEAARIVDVPSSTLASWAKGYIRRFPDRSEVSGDPVLTYLPTNTFRGPTIPFIGLAEGLVLAAIRRSGVPMQRVRPALDELQRQMGIDHALASRWR